MAKHENLTTLFTAIADSIRNKTGGTDAIIADDFPEAIDDIQTGGGVDKIQKWIELNNNSMGYLFDNFTGKTIGDLLDGIDTSSITDMTALFMGCTALTSVPLFDTGKVQGMSSMFASCLALTTVPLFDTKSALDMSFMFNGSRNLTTIPSFNTVSLVNANQMFNNCQKLTSIPALDTRNMTSVTNMFSNCQALTSIQALDMRNVTNASSMFSNCTSLTECWLRNIKTNLQVGYGTSYGHLLTLENLLHLCKECRKTTSSKKLTMGTANLAKLEGIYVKLIDITDDMRAEDDLIDEKYPFVQCESTDEGAMTIQDYMATKMWSLA